MKKKKVSFDIDSELYANIQEFCKNRGIKQSDFYRDASLEKYDRDINNIDIYVYYDGNIEKYNIDKSMYKIDFWEADEKMKENVGAVHQGKISHTLLSKELVDRDYKRVHSDTLDYPSDTDGRAILGLYLIERKEIPFFTKERYFAEKSNTE